MVIERRTARERAAPRRARRSLVRRAVTWLARAALAFVLLTVGSVAALRFVDPIVTPLMLLRGLQGAFEGRFVGIDRQWVDLDQVSPHLLRAVIAAEDARFFQHHGVDFEELERARAYNERQKGKRVRGASTITMQCARSTFLWTDRSWLRKGIEVYFTALIELLWSKRRILEVYVNVVEWGDGVYGVEAASERAFGVPASRLGARQAALLAAVLPAPRRWNPARPTPGVRARAARIEAWARSVDLRPLG
jgi:monofunctional biosynthetic peptidoglycan transglycosylase